jgi:hypothetical protein
LVVSIWGVEVAFIIDALSFFVAAAIIATIPIPQSYDETRKLPLLRTGLANIAEGWSIIIRTPAVRRIVTAKALWAFSGGGLVFLIVLVGDEIGFSNLAAGLGLLFAARGIGTGIGPLIGRVIFTDRTKWIGIIGWMVVVSGLSYTALSFLGWTPWIALLITLAHAASGANWVFSTVLLQESSEDEWRGRVFSVDFMLMCIVHALSALVASACVEHFGFSLRATILGFAISQVVVGLLWVAWMRVSVRSEAQRATSAIS